MLRSLTIITWIAIGRSHCETSQTRSSGVAVHIVVTDCWGNPVPAANIVITDVAEQQASDLRLSYPSESHASLPTGHYRVMIRAQGFFTFSQIIGFAGDNVELRSCLELAPIEGTTQLKAQLKGTVFAAPETNLDSFWLRLVGLYSDVNLSTSVSLKGAFSFAGLEPGRYLLLLFDRNGLSQQTEIDVRGPLTVLTESITGTPTHSLQYSENPGPQSVVPEH